MNDSPPQLPSDEVRTVPPAVNNATGAYVTADGETRTVPPRETAASASAIPNLPPGYEFLRELGRGGMGVVYQARDTKLNRIVALKMILAGSHAAQSEMQRFLKEAEAVAALQHPNIVQIFETGQHHGLPYFTLEFVDGGTLAAKVRDLPLPPKEAALMVEQLAHGMTYAHAKGIVHRDLKPENVLLATDGTPKITDFGLAKRIEAGPGSEAAGLTQTGAIMGTPSYMAPEQAAGQKEIGPLADVYALGAILYRLLTGRPPFQAATPLDTIMQVVADEPAPASRLNPQVPRDLEAIVHKCLEKKNTARYGSAQELADDMHRFLGGEPVHARPVGWLDRKAKWVRRHPVAAAAYGLAALVLLLVAIGGGFAKLWRDASKARDTARDAEKNEKQARGELEQEKLRSEAALQGKLNAEQAVRATRDDLIGEFQYMEAIRRVQRYQGAGSGGLAFTELYGTDPKRRAWEWSYLAQQFPWPMKGHLGPVTCVCFSPDGRQLASASHDNTIRLWNLAAGGNSSILRGHTGPVSSVSFSPDGNWLASGSEDKTVRVWDLAGGATQVLKGHDSVVMCVSFSPNGRLLASGSGNILEQGKGDCTIRIWDLQAGGDPQVLRGHTHSVRSVNFSPDGRRLASASLDRTVRIWDVVGKGASRILQSNGDSIWSTVFSPDRRWLAAACGGIYPNSSFFNCVLVWDLARGGQARKLDTNGASVRSVDFSPDGQYVASGAIDNTILVWNLAAGGEPRVLKGHAYAVLSVHFSPDGRWLASGSVDGMVLVWDLAAGEGVVRKGQFRSITFGPDGRRLASIGDKQLVRVWDLTADDEPSVLPGAAGQIGTLNFSPDGRFLASGSWDKSVKVWNMVAGGQPFTLKADSEVNSLSFSPDGQRLACGAVDKAVRVWNLQNRAEPRLLQGHSGVVWAVSFAPDGRRLASGSDDKKVRIWDLVGGGQPLVLNGHDARVTTLMFSADGRWLASGSEDKTVRLWDLVGGAEPLVLKGHASVVDRVSFSPDGRRLASCSRDNDVRIWDLAGGGEILSLNGAVNPITNLSALSGVSFGPDGRRLASISGGGIRVWEFNCQHLWRFRQATDAERNKAWFAARFHLHWLIQEERAKQCCEMTSALTSPSPLGAAANLVALQDREGRVPLPDLQKRHFRATMQLAGWFWF